MFREAYVVYNWRVCKWRGRGDTFYTSNKFLARKFASKTDADSMCGANERVERVFTH